MTFEEAPVRGVPLLRCTGILAAISKISGEWGEVLGGPKGVVAAVLWCVTFSVQGG